MTTSLIIYPGCILFSAYIQKFDNHRSCYINQQFSKSTPSPLDSCTVFQYFNNVNLLDQIEKRSTKSFVLKH
jgi:hypothetical protein